MSEDPKVIIAENIKKYLEINNMNQKTLAEKINIKPSTVSDYLNYRSKPSHGIIQKIADVFGVHKSDIDTTYKDDVQKYAVAPEKDSVPSWATAKDVRDIKKILKEDLPVMFDGKLISEENRQRIADLVAGFLWESKEENKQTYGRKRKAETPENNEKR